ncbi:MAG TPA: alpha/beta hydrolase [Candidatus Sulfotelmatobacter sp.]|nr:alpha/beta hydrolase [Candidatus Sulfotelmatobacter sp.]
MQRLWKWIKRSFILGTSLVVAVVCFGAVYQAIASHFDSNSFPPPGRRIDVGGYRLHLYCQGRGNPIIVVNPGVGVWSLQWSKIQGALAQDTRICTYDRGGYGWSDSGVSTPTASQAADELHVLLEKAVEHGPYVLVGESYGGYVTRLFVEKYRRDVAAVVLVESAHERQWDELPRAKALALQAQQQLRVGIWLSRIGFFRLLPMDRGEDLSPAVRRAFVATQARTQTFAAFHNEMRGAFASAQQAGETHSFGDLPLVVVSAGRSFDKFFPAGEKETGPMNEKWMRLQDELTMLSTNSVRMVSETATHGIAREQPEFVIAAIRKALQLAVAHQTQIGYSGLPLNGQISGRSLNN